MRIINQEKAQAVLAAMAAPEETEAPAVIEETVREEQSVIINRDGQHILLVGSDLLGPKEVEIIATMLNYPGIMDDRAIRSVVISDEAMLGPNDKAATGLASFPCQAVALSLPNIWERTLGEVLEDGTCGLLPTWQYEIMVTLGHEITHVQFGGDISEDDADHSGQVLMWDLAKKFDIEPGDWLEMPYFSARVKELLYGLKAEQGEWADKQRFMLENRLMFWQERTEKYKEVKGHTFKFIAQLNAGDDPDAGEDEDWHQSPVPGPSLDQLLHSLNPREPIPDTPDVVTMGGGDPDLDFDAGIESEMAAAVAAYKMEQGMPAPAGPMAVGTPAPQTPVQQAAVPQTPAFTPTQAPSQQFQPTGGVGQLPNMGGTACIGIPAEQAAPIIDGIYAKIYNHLFGTCERTINKNYGFEHPERVYTPIALTPEERKVLVSFKTHVDGDANTSQEIDVMVDDTTLGIQGLISKQAKIPMYRLVFQCDAINQHGYLQRVLVKRSVVPQNVNKMNKDGSGLSQYAINARAGSCIMYVFEDEQSLKVPGKDIRYRNIDGNIWKPGA